MTTEIAGEFKAGLIPPTNESGQTDEAILLRIHSNAEHFTNGEQGILKWNTQKQDIIVEMANDISFLIGKRHPKYLGKTNEDISSLICETLREHKFVDENIFSWIRKVLAPLGFTNSKFANTSVQLGRADGVIKKPFTYISKEQLHEVFAKMTTDEQVQFYNNVLATDTERKRQIKLTKDNMRLEFEARGIDPRTYNIKSNKYDPAYDENYDDADDMPMPPEELKQNQLLRNKIGERIEKIKRLVNIWSGVYEKLALFPPQDHDLDKRCADMAQIENDQIWNFLIKASSPFNDDKAVSTFDGWFDYLYQKAIHGNNAAASKFAAPTGEYQEVTRPDGTKFLQALKRKVTNEHLKKKMPEQIKEIKNYWLFDALFSSMRTWFKDQYYVVGGSDIENAEVEREYKENQA